MYGPLIECFKVTRCNINVARHDRRIRDTQYLTAYFGTRRNRFVHELLQHGISKPQIAKFPCRAESVGKLWLVVSPNSSDANGVLLRHAMLTD